LLDLVFKLLGTPQGVVLDLYKSYPDWEKLTSTNTTAMAGYVCRLRQEYDRLFGDSSAMSLLEGLVAVNPSDRLTATQALTQDYFLLAPPPAPEE